MDETTKIVWNNLAQQHPSLRFPNVSLEIMSPFNEFARGKGIVKLTTFIKSKDKTRLTLFRQQFESNKENNIFDFLDHVKSRFIKERNLISENYIFNKDTSIHEPFEINKQ